MKKRLLSMLMAMCLMATMVPAAFAADTDQPDTITLPNGEVREIPTVELPDSPATLAETNSNEVKKIDSIEKFDGITPEEWRSGKTFKITTDLNLAESTKTVAEWGGFIPYFYGKMIGEKADGTTPVISGIPNNCGFIYGIVGGTIQNLTFKHDVSAEDGSASFIAFMPTRMTGANQHLTMENVKITGDISLTGSDQSNYAPYLYAAPLGGLTMKDCTNYADITGSIYGSVFHGYYPLNFGKDTPYEFINCVNEGDVTMQYAGMFFGNSSSMEGKVGSDELYLTISGCKNNGEIRGTSGAKYFAAPVSEFGSNMDDVEAALEPAPANAIVAGSVDIDPIHVEKIGGTGSLCEKEPLTGFGASLDEDGLTLNITRAKSDKTSGVHHYTVAISTYVNMWDTDTNSFEGTDRYTVSKDYDVESLSEGVTTFGSDLLVYGFADIEVGSYAGKLAGTDIRLRKDSNGTLYYEVDRESGAKPFELYVSNQKNENGPVGNGTKAAEIVTVAAYTESGVMLDCVTVDLP